LTSAEQLEVVEVKPGLRFGKGVLVDILPDIETALFFGKVYDLDAQQLGNLLLVVFDTPLVKALVGSSDEHSHQLQDYLVDLTYDMPAVTKGQLKFKVEAPKGEILPELWKSLEVEVATSIKAVASKLQSTVGLMPGKQGSMVFRSLNVMNRRRPTIGDYKAQIHHAPLKENLVIFDVSGSMSEGTVRTIVDDVVALSYMANAHLAIVSNTCTHWEPGTFNSDEVLQHAEFGGTQYETLAPLFDREWGVVVCIADYDSSYAAGPAIARMKGHIDEVLDISLVSRPTFLAQVVGQLADITRPLLMGNSPRVLRA
jgi:hypothetical protein